MTSLPAQALDTQLDLLRYYESEPGSRYAGAVIEAMFTEGMDKTNPLYERIVHISHQFGVFAHRRLVGTAETYAVTSEIVDVLEAAYPNVPDFELTESDLPAPCGFIFLERTVIIPDGKGKPLAVKAVGWHTAVRRTAEHTSEESAATYLDGTSLTSGTMIVRDDDPIGVLSGDSSGNGILIMLWTDAADDRDHAHDELFSELEPYLKTLNQSSFAPPHRLWSMWGGMWEFGRTPMSDLSKLLMTFLRFIEEPWVDERMILPERATARRAQRRKLEPKIKVVQLRRRELPIRRQPSGEPVDYDHRWIVSAFWRQQYMPLLGKDCRTCGGTLRVHRPQDDKPIPCPGCHRPRWIAEHIKGPDDKPLVVNDRVFHVAR